MKKFTSRSAQRGLTLIELVVVMAILIALAGLVLPRLDFLKSQASLAGSSSNVSELATLIQTYKSSNTSGAYPGLDTLLDSSGAVASQVWSSAGPLVTAWSVPGANTGSAWYRSLLDGGLRTGYTMGAGADASNLAVGTSQDLFALSAPSGGGASTLNLAALAYSAGTPPSGGAGIDYAPYNGTVAKSALPSTLWTYSTSTSTWQHATKTYQGSPVQAQLVSMGIGPNTDLVGSMIQACPLDQQSGDSTTAVYSRYLAVYAVYNDGTPARLVAVTDHRGRPVASLTSDYNTASGTATVN